MDQNVNNGNDGGSLQEVQDCQTFIILRIVIVCISICQFHS